MPFDIPKAVEAVGKATEKGFSYAEKAKERQSEAQIIKINKRLQEAVNTAEEIFLYIDSLRGRFSIKEWDKYVKLKREFNKKD